MSASFYQPQCLPKGLIYKVDILSGMEAIHRLDSIDAPLTRLIRLAIAECPSYLLPASMASFFGGTSEPPSDKLSLLIEAILIGLMF